MARIEFYINDSERKELINYILSSGAMIIPDILYDSQDYAIANSLIDFQNYLENDVSRFFIIKQNYAIENLTFLEIDFEQGLKYKIKQRVGGPYIDIVFYFGYSKDAVVRYKMSILDYYPKFLNTKGFEYNVPNELKNYYVEISKFIKSKCKSVLIQNHRKLISQEVLHELEF